MEEKSYSRDYRDLIAGGLLFLIGGSVGYYCLTTLALGSVQRMGPGLFPGALGVVLAVMGLGILIPALFRAGTAVEDIEWRSGIFVLGSVAAFAATVRPFGIIPAIVALAVVAQLAEPRIRPRAMVGLCIVLPLMAWLIFKVALGLQIPMFRWGF